MLNFLANSLTAYKLATSKCIVSMTALAKKEHESFTPPLTSKFSSSVDTANSSTVNLLDQFASLRIFNGSGANFF